MTRSEIQIAYRSPSRRVYMRGDLVYNELMIVMVTSTVTSDDKFIGTILHVHSKSDAHQIGLHSTFDAREFEPFTQKLILSTE
jgi:hypothetical protein